MIANIIIGKQSFVTKALLRFIKKAEVFSANDLDITTINKIQSKKKINLIFNNFYPSHKLNDLNSSEYQKFVELSLLRLAQILSNLKITK